MTEAKTISPGPGTTGKRKLYAVASAAVLCCLLAYGMALGGPLFFDDVPNLLANNLVQIDGTSFDDWRVATLSSSSGLFYRPVAMFSFALNYVACGTFSPVGLKATNLAIHLAMAGLVYFFVLALLRTPALQSLGLSAHQRRVVALLSGSIWLLHPIHASTVLYAVQRMAQLSALFTLAGLLLFVRYRLRWADTGAGPGEIIAALVWILLLGLLAVLSKENGALLPWLIAVVEVTLFWGIWAGRPRKALVWFGWGVFALPLLAVVLMYLVYPELLTNGFAGREFSLEERLLSQARALWRYIGWLLLPNIMDMGFFHDDIPVSRGLWSPYTTALSLAAWLAIIITSLVLRKRYPLLCFSLFFYLVAHSMESTVLPLEMVFEHRNYLPAVGPIVFVAMAILQCAARFDGLSLRVASGGVLALLVILLGVRTFAWKDEMSLARFNVINHPQSARANFFYANALFKRFEQSAALGLSEQEQQALAVASRQFFLQMHHIDERDFAALVMLYQLDTRYFPGLSEENDWLGVMESLAQTRLLQPSDYTALGALVDFSGAQAGESGRARVGAMLDQLAERYPWRMDLLAHRYKFAVLSPDGDREKLRISLEQAAQFNSANPKASAYLAQFYGNNELAAAYEAIGDWMQRDAKRRELSAIRGVFSN